MHVQQRPRGTTKPTQEFAVDKLSKVAQDFRLDPLHYSAKTSRTLRTGRHPVRGELIILLFGQVDANNFRGGASFYATSLRASK